MKTNYPKTTYLDEDLLRYVITNESAEIILNFLKELDDKSNVYYKYEPTMFGHRIFIYGQQTQFSKLKGLMFEFTKEKEIHDYNLQIYGIEEVMNIDGKAIDFYYEDFLYSLNENGYPITVYFFNDLLVDLNSK